MSATDELRRMLDERGVEWTANDGEHVKETCWPYMGELTAVFAEYDNGTTRFACDMWCFTPEQAVEATLGPGTLSASQVSNAVYAHSIHADCADADWKAIADELNNTLGSCSCTNSERTTTVDEVERIGISWRDGRHVRKLFNENTKLRELVWRLLEVERIGATSAEWHELLEQASELGVEVDER